MIIGLVDAPTSYAVVTPFGTPTYDCSTHIGTLHYTTDVDLDIEFQITPDTPVISGYLGAESSFTVFGPLYLAEGVHPFDITVNGTDTYPLVMTVACEVLPGGFTPVVPYRLMDTRIAQGGSGPLAPGGVRELQVTGRGGVPASGVGAVMLNVTAVTPTAPGFLTVYPAGLSAPRASNLNFTAGQVVPNQVLAKIGTGGMISILNGSSGTTEVVVDLAGWFVDGIVVDSGGVVPVLPFRLVDTRTSMGGVGPLEPDESRRFNASERGVLPSSGVIAAVVNLTAVSPTSSGYLTAYDSDLPAPATSNVNFTPGQVVPNLAFVELGRDGTFLVHNGSPGRTEVVVDVVGFVIGSGPIDRPGMYQPWGSQRVMDTRVGPGRHAIPGGQEGATTVMGTSGLLAQDISAAVMNLTVVAGTRAGYLTAYPVGTAVPNASNVNFVAGQVVPNLAVVMTSDAGSIAVLNGSAAEADVVIDVFGYFLA